MKHRLSRDRQAAQSARAFPPRGRLCPATQSRARTIIKAVTPFTAAGNALTFQRHLQNSFLDPESLASPPSALPSLTRTQKNTRNKWIYAAVKRDNKTSRFPIYEISHGCKGTLQFYDCNEKFMFPSRVFSILGVWKRVLGGSSTWHATLDWFIHKDLYEVILWL